MFALRKNEINGKRPPTIAQHVLPQRERLASFYGYGRKMPPAANSVLADRLAGTASTLPFGFTDVGEGAFFYARIGEGLAVSY